MTLLTLVSKRIDVFFLKEVNEAVKRFISEYLNRDENSDSSIPDNFVILARGTPAEPDSFPEYPTDVWLARFTNDGDLVGVYSVHLDELSERLAMPVDKAFPPCGFANDFWNFWRDSDDHNVAGDYGYVLLRYHKEAEKQRDTQLFDYELKRHYPKDIAPQDKEYIERFLGKELEEDPEAEAEGSHDVVVLLDELSEEEKLALDIGNKALDFSVRSFNCLSRAGVYTVSDIVVKSRQELSMIRNLSQKCVDEVELKIKRLGFTLKDSQATDGDGCAD